MSAGGEINSMGTILAAAKAANETARVAYDEGYRIGYREGVVAGLAEAQQIIGAAFKPVEVQS